jgi:hypothetical protein
MHHVRAVLPFAIMAVCAATTALAKAPTLSTVDFSTCANNLENGGGPVGASVGNAQTKFSKLNFTLLDPASGVDSWIGGAGQTLDVKLSVASPAAVYLLINSGYGQGGIANATIELKAKGGVKKSFKLIGNATIRDFNNWVWTNTLTKRTSQEWWTNNLNPQPQDQSHRYDAHMIDTASLLAGQTLSDIIVKAPANAGPNFMEPLVWAIAVDTGTGAQTIKSSCTAQ